MTIDIRPWKRLLPVWLPTMAVCLGAAFFFAWQTSDSGGRRSQVQDRVAELESELTRIEGLLRAAEGDRDSVAELESQFSELNDSVFGTLDGRLTDILRAVGSATRNAGLLPGGYSYSATEERNSGFIRFSITFSVQGEYRQIRQMLAALQSSEEFLLVEGLSLVGDTDPVSRDLEISVRIATFLVDADPEQLRRLTGGISVTSGGTGG